MRVLVRSDSPCRIQLRTQKLCRHRRHQAMHESRSFDHAATPMQCELDRDLVGESRVIHYSPRDGSKSL